MKNRRYRAPLREIHSKADQIHKVTIISPKTKIWRFWIQPVLIWRVVEVLGFTVAIYALYLNIKSIELSIYSNDLSRESNYLAQNELEQESINSSWQVLGTSSSGNSGKVHAIETLVEKGETLSGINISCSQMSGGWNSEKNTCERRTYLKKLTLKKGNFDHSNLNGVDLENSSIEGISASGGSFKGSLFRSMMLKSSTLNSSKFDGAVFAFSEFTGNKFTNSSFKGSGFIGMTINNCDFGGTELNGIRVSDSDFSNVSFEYSDLSGASFSKVRIKNSSFKNANVSSTEFCRRPFRPGDLTFCTYGLTQEQIDDAWAWQDQLPYFGKDGLLKLELKPPKHLCPPHLREEYINNHDTGIPKGC